MTPGTNHLVSLAWRAPVTDPKTSVAEVEIRPLERPKIAATTTVTA
jgi:hypothetical protein